MNTDEFQYSGSELELFEKATHWKSYISSKIKPYVAGKVLEVGSGLGTNVSWVMNSKVESWTGLEPDFKLFEKFKAKFTQEIQNGTFLVKQGYLSDLAEVEKFDTILYLDVLEHIEKDSFELQTAFSKLNEGGVIIVFAPALQFLFNDFDKAIGHYRRYNAKTLRKLTPSGAMLLKIKYFDSIGFILSLGNKWFLRQSNPSLEQVLIWDRLVVPLSKGFDCLIGHSFGKNILAVWGKPPIVS